MAVRAIDCFGEPMYLAALGGGVARDALLSHSAKGIHRILTANRRAGRDATGIRPRERATASRTHRPSQTAAA
jgi:hypothetical protein